MSCSTCNKTPLQTGINIIKGVCNTIIHTEETENLHDKRIPICNSCTDARPLIKIGGTQYYYCSLCTCSCSQKVRVKDEKCPKGKW